MSVPKKACYAGLTYVGLLLYLWAIASCGLKAGAMGLSIYLAFYALCFFCVYSKMSADAIKAVSKKDLIASALICIAVGVFYIVFIGGERWIYSHDYGGYWQSTIEIYSHLSSSISQTFEFVFDSINNDDYNRLLPLLLSTPLHMLGGSRAAFVGLVYFSFIVPIAYVLYLCTKTLKQSKHGGIPLWLACLFVCTFPVLMGSVLGGMFDTSYALLMAICFLMYFQWNRDTRFSTKYSCCLGICITLILLFRRTSAFWVVGFAVAVILLFLIRLLRSDGKPQLIKIFFAEYGIALLIVLVVLLAFFPGLIERGLHNDFSFAYSAYNSGKSPVEHAIEIMGVSGSIVAIICMIGMSLTIYLKCGLEQFALLAITSLIAVNLFWRIQDLSIQHYNIIAIQIALWVIISISLLLQLIERSRSKARGIASKSVLALMVILSVASCLNMTLVASTPRPFDALSSIKHLQQRRDDLDAIYGLLDSIPAGSKVYVVSSSDVFNISIAINGYLQRGEDLSVTVYSAEVDLRDGFNNEFFEADYVINCTPAQTHLKPSSQHVIVDLEEAFSENLYGIDRHYELLRTTDLINGVEAFLYKKTSDFTNEEIQQIAEHFDSIYPDNKDLFYERIINAQK